LDIRQIRVALPVRLEGWGLDQVGSTVLLEELQENLPRVVALSGVLATGSSVAPRRLGTQPEECGVCYRVFGG
jgi:hypothetical protein